jgi:hypothetical protein
MSKLFVLTSWDRFLDTGRTFALSKTLSDLAGGRGGDIGGTRKVIDHLRDVTEKTPYVRDYEADSSDEWLILVATAEGGPSPSSMGDASRSRASPRAQAEAEYALECGVD